MNKLKDFFKVNDSYKCAKYSFIFTLCFGILSYNLYVIYGYTNPDGIVEGLTSYINATWHITGCGRWMLPIILLISANVHMPLLTVIAYITLMWLSAFTIAKLWKIKSCTLVTLFSLIMSVNKSTIDHITTNTVAFPYAVACYLAILFVYILFEKKGISKYIVSIICLTCSLGIYQTYIGLSACLILMTIIIKLIKNDEKNLLKTIVDTIICAFISCALYLIILKTILLIFNLTSGGRVGDLSISKILKNLIPQIKNIYVSYFVILNDYVLFKNIIYLLIGIVLIITIIISLINIDNNKKIAIIICLLLIPLASNIASLIAYNSQISSNMCFQNVLIIPFTLSLVKIIIKNKFINVICILLTLVLCWTFLVSANATFRCYQLSHDSIKYQMSLIMDDVIHDDDYILNESKVLFVGYPNDKTLRENIKTYKYAYHFDEMSNIAFWEDTANGYTYNRQKYILNYFGVDIKDLSFNDYLDVINSNEFKQMPIWPVTGSIKKINDIIVVKLTNNPYSE